MTLHCAEVKVGPSEGISKSREKAENVKSRDKEMPRGCG
jgi:hypothetical protein